MSRRVQNGCEDGLIMRRALNLEVGGQRNEGKVMRTWRRQVEEESVKVC